MNQNNTQIKATIINFKSTLYISKYLNLHSTYMQRVVLHENITLNDFKFQKNPHRPAFLIQYFFPKIILGIKIV